MFPCNTFNQQGLVSRVKSPTHTHTHSYAIPHYQQGSLGVGDKRPRYSVVCLHKVSKSVRAHINTVWQQWLEYTKGPIIALVLQIEHKEIKYRP